LIGWGEEEDGVVGSWAAALTRATGVRRQRSERGTSFSVAGTGKYLSIMYCLQLPSNWHMNWTVEAGHGTVQTEKYQE
jgi:hypothetical protein